jgi:hypothetical protein
MPIYLDETRNGLSPLTDYQSGFGEYVGAKAVGAFKESPAMLSAQTATVFDAEHGTNLTDQMFDTGLTGSEIVGKYIDSTPKEVVRLSADDARKKIKETGVKLTVPDSGISAEALDLLIKNQQDRTARNLAIERSPNGLRNVAGFGAAFAGSLLDPINVATGLVPIIGEARYTSLLAQSAGSFAGRTAIRAGVGFAEGVVGTAALEPMMMGLNKQLQNDYNMTDSLLNVAFGGVFGGGLHTIGGGFGEGLRNYGGKAHPWDAYRGLSMNESMTVMKFQSMLEAGKIEDVGAATAGWTERMREAAGFKGAEPPAVVREDGYQPREAPEAPFARLYETTPEAARMQAIGDVRETIRADLLATAGNRAEGGDIAQLRSQLDDTKSRLESLNEADFKRRAKEAQQQGMSRKEAESAARKQINDELSSLEATKKNIEQQIDTNAKASQAEQMMAALDKGEVPPAYEHLVQARIEQIAAAADMARATLQMDQMPAPFVIGMASPQTRQVALSTAVAHLAQGQSVNVEPIFHIEAGKMSPADVVAAAQRQQQPSASGLADESASAQATERLARSDKKDANLEAAQKASDSAVERLNQTIANLEKNGASPELIERLRAEQKQQGLYSRGQSAGSTVEETTSALRESFDGDGGKLVDSGAVKVVQTVAELPARADGQPHPADTKGMFDGKNGYIVADNVAAADAPRVLLHEAGVHYGMRQMLGEGLFRKLTKEVEKRAAAGEEGFVDGLRQVPSDTPDHQVAEEIMAYLVENRPELPLVKRIISQIKAFLYRVLDGNLINLSPDDIRTMAVAALKKVSSAEAMGARSAEPPNYARGAKQAIEAQGGTVKEVAPLDQIASSDRIPMITLKDLIGMRLIPTIADRTKAGALFTGIDGSKLQMAVPLLGGPNFPLRESNMDAGVVWANRGKSVASLKKGKMDQGAEYMMVVLGSPDMHKSNSTVANAMIGQIRSYLSDRRITKGNAEKLTNLIRNTKEADANIAEALRNFPDLSDSEKAISYLDSISFEARKRVATVLSSVQASDMGAPNFQKILDATVEPEYAGNRWGDGVLVVKLNRENPFITLGENGTQPHPDYPLGMTGEVVGKLKTPVNYELLWQDWLSKANADALARGTPAEKINTRRAFELGKPMVEITPDLVKRIGDLNSGDLTPRQAKLVTSAMNDRWATSDTFGKGGMRSASPTEFWHEMQRSQASAIMPRLDAKEITDQVRAKTRTIYQLDDAAKDGPASRIYFSLRKEANRVVLDSWLNNEVGAKGYGGATIAKAVAEGATHAEVLAVPTVGHPMGRTIEMLEALGFKVEKAKKADLGGKANRADALDYFKRNGWKEGEPEPQLVTLKWSGNDGQRAGFSERYLAGNFDGIRREGAVDHVAAATDAAQSSDRSANRKGGGSEPNARANEGDQGQSGSPVGSDLRQLAADIGRLSDNELLNLGLTRNELGRIADGDFQAKLLDEVKSINKAFDEGVKDAQGLGEAVNAAAVCGLRN